VQAAIKERPILFSGEMVRAILDGRKTQTRRIINPQPERKPVMCGWVASGFAEEGLPNEYGVTGCSCKEVKCRYGFGDHLWVRETWRLGGEFYDCKLSVFSDPEEMLGQHVHYRVDDFEGEGENTYRPSIFMPRWASRITIEINDIRAERLQEISEEDAKAEGWLALSEDGMSGYGDDATLHRHPEYTYRWGYKSLWNSINGPGSWDANPWVWAITFKRVEVSNAKAL
jgi:hypothetical protein